MLSMLLAIFTLHFAFISDRAAPPRDCRGVDAIEFSFTSAAEFACRLRQPCHAANRPMLLSERRRRAMICRETTLHAEASRRLHFIA